VWHASTFLQMEAIGNSIKNRNQLTIELINQTAFWARLGQLSFHVFFHWVSLTNITNNKHNNIANMIACTSVMHHSHVIAICSRFSHKHHEAPHPPKQTKPRLRIPAKCCSRRPDSRSTVQTVPFVSRASVPSCTRVPH
jgi:hypothetical protein